MTGSIICKFQIVYSSVWKRMAEENNRRYPPNLRGLLNFCTEYTQTEDAPSTSDVSVMSEEVVFNYMQLLKLLVLLLLLQCLACLLA